MKYVVRVADQYYEVEIEDIHARPIVARVDGQEFRVNPEDGVKLAIQKEKTEMKAAESSKHPASPDITMGELAAPLPGTVIEMFVRTGEYVEAGQVLLIIEAMKMKNSIRSTRAGKITEVLVKAGETVTHKQTLVRFG
jgi:glutaconyl-CoA/methylmalonyl-CoA decarboxylase subunit gamma